MHWNRLKITKENKMLYAYPICLLTAFGASVALLLVLALVLFRFGMTEKGVELGVMAIYLLSNFAGGFMAGKSAGKRKYLWGGAVGGTYFLLLAVISYITGMGNGEMSGLTALLLCMSGGMLGGMLS